MKPDSLQKRLANAAFAFRGYNTTNLGRTAELLMDEQYGEITRTFLAEASAVASDYLGKSIDLIERVTQGEETTLADYGEAIALVVAVEQAQLAILREFFQIDIGEAKVALGYSLGEISALVACQVIDLQDALRAPLKLAADCIELAEGVTLGVCFSRDQPLQLPIVQKCCVRISQRGRGVIGISAQLSPNSVLLMGQNGTLMEFRAAFLEATGIKVAIKRDPHSWPPLHTNLTWQRNLPDRASVLMQGLAGGFVAPQPDIISLVTGESSYNDFNAREMLRRWVDHPQLLWDAIFELLSMNIETVVHVGPEPNIIPATLKRLHDNVEAQTKGSIGMRALKAVVDHPWVRQFLPSRTALVRVLSLTEVVLENWLLDEARS